MYLRLITTFVFGIAAAGPVLGELIISEFSSDPVSEGWILSQQFGDLTTWVEEGAYHQLFANNCEPGPVCGTQSFFRSIQAFNGRPSWFYEYRVSATADHNEIQNGAPTVLSAFNAFGNLYHAALASDKVKLSGDGDIPFLFLDVEADASHTIRLELYNDPPPAMFHWYVDSILVLEGLADSPFPDFDARIKWQGRTWMQPTLNAWYYIRAGDPPSHASGDFNSDSQIDDFDFFYFSECIDRSASGEPAFPSCAWADMDADTDVDCDDWEAFNSVWTDTDDPPFYLPCFAPPIPIPTVSDWGLLTMTLLMLSAMAITFRRRVPSLAMRG